MANNENVNKVVYGNQTLIDLTEDSVTSETLLDGETAHDRSGAQITGTAKQGHVIQNNGGTDLTQRSKLQFKGLNVTDDSENGKTIVEKEDEYEKITYAQYLQLTQQQIANGKYIVEGSGEATGIFGKILIGSLAIGDTTVVLQDSFITTTSMIDVYTDVYGVNPTNVTVTTGSITLTFEAQESVLNVKVRVM